MKLICIITLFCTFGCSQIDSSKSTRRAGKQDYASITLEQLVYVDMFSPNYTTQHPLVCGAGRDFPEGRELAFRHANSKEPVHAVFPEAVKAPEDPNGTFVLHGHFQGIQKRDYYKIKKPNADYRYFVVSSWKRSK